MQFHPEFVRLIQTESLLLDDIQNTLPGDSCPVEQLLTEEFFA